MTSQKLFHRIVLGAALAFTPAVSQAQGAAAAEARARLVCGSGTVVSATYIPGGLLQVTCRENAPNSSNSASGNNGLGTGGLGTTGIAAGVVAAAVVLTVIANDSDSSTTTTEQDVEIGE